MIYDTKHELVNYKGISKSLDTAIDYILKTQLNALKPGIYEIDGDRVIIHIQQYETKDVTEVSYEAHKKYIDIQMAIEGKEYCYYAPLTDLIEKEPFDDAKDIGFFNSEIDRGIALHLAPPMVAVFFPQDAHKPCCKIREAALVKKIVVKVKV